MTPAQIKALDATEKRLGPDGPRRHYWHYRRTPATSSRDALWQYANRSTSGEWETLPERPPMEVLLRLVPKGSATHDGLRWHGFHDPYEFDQGY